jgi:hypothetical protein
MELTSATAPSRQVLLQVLALVALPHALLAVIFTLAVPDIQSSVKLLEFPPPNEYVATDVDGGKFQFNV